MKTRGLKGVLMLTLALASHGAIAQQNGKARASPIEGAMLVQVIGEVRSVDADAHRVTVADAQGHVMQMNVGQEVRDLDKLPIGTRIKSTVLQPVMLTPVKSAPPQAMIPGDRQFVVRVASVDGAAGVVMLKDADDLPIEVRTQDPRAATALAPGASVEVKLVKKSPVAK